MRAVLKGCNREVQSILIKNEDYYIRSRDKDFEDHRMYSGSIPLKSIMEDKRYEQMQEYPRVCYSKEGMLSSNEDMDEYETEQFFNATEIPRMSIFYKNFEKMDNWLVLEKLIPVSFEKQVRPVISKDTMEYVLRKVCHPTTSSKVVSHEFHEVKRCNSIKYISGREAGPISLQSPSSRKVREWLNICL